MPYKIKVAKDVEAFILGQNFPLGVVDQICHKILHELPDKGPAMLGEVVVPFATRRAWHVTAEDRSHHPYRWWIVFVVDTATPGELHVIAARHAGNADDVLEN